MIRNGRLQVCELPPGALAVRLPSEREWEALAGGVEDERRYPWDPPAGPATTDEGAILARANTAEAGLGGPSPVAMYPLGASRPHGLMDLAGNVWEWNADWYGQSRSSGVLRGGSWFDNLVDARCAFRLWYGPGYSSSSFGFRCVSPISPSGS